MFTQSPPTVNPVASHYGREAYPRTDDIYWGSVFNIADFVGPTLTRRHVAARVANNQVTGPITVCPAGNGANAEVRGHTGTGAISACCFVVATNNPGFTVSSCWSGNTGNRPPAISVTPPAPNALLNAGNPRTVSVITSDPDGRVTGVVIYPNNVAISSLTLTNLPAGKYSLGARATDHAGRSEWSWPVAFRVVPPPIEAWCQQQFVPQAGNPAVAGAVSSTWVATRTVREILDLGPTQRIKVRDHVPVGAAGQRYIRLWVRR